MDLSLIGAYRLVWADIVLIQDACLNVSDLNSQQDTVYFNYSSSQCYHLNKFNVTDVSRALQLIVSHEEDVVYNNISLETTDYAPNHLTHDVHEINTGSS